ncbi:MAG: hypothetical protein Q8O63_04425 [Hoeflea sp.]|nr:hypothetical protein [Hoeflea sp.]
MMIYSIGPNSRPFEPARRTDALREEDEFMALHGGAGSRLIYLTVDWLASRIDAAVLRASRMWKRRPPPCPSGRLSMDR